MLQKLKNENLGSLSLHKNLSYVEVHVSKSFLVTPSLASALYLMLLRFLGRDYAGVAIL